MGLLTKNYEHFQQEKPDWCLPACMQSIIQFRTLARFPQARLAELSKTTESGTKISEKKLDEFIKSFGFLSCEHLNPFTTPYFDYAEKFLEERLADNNDVLVFYNYLALQQIQGEHSRHVSIVTRFNPKSEKVYLHDPAQKPISIVDLFGAHSLINSMQARENMDHGFYVIKSS